MARKGLHLRQSKRGYYWIYDGRHYAAGPFVWLDIAEQELARLKGE